MEFRLISENSPHEEKMKKLILIIIFLLSIAIPVSAQDDDWRVEFFEDYDNNAMEWPLGTEIQGTMNINRVIKESAYVWDVVSADPNVSWMGLNFLYPTDVERYRFSAEVRLPDFDPLTCAGLMLDNQGSTFYGFVICNDKTYSLFKSTAGKVETLIPYTPIKDYDNFSAFTMSAEVNSGWIDLYYNDQTLDT
jgi:hypothetical protein